MEIGVRDQDDLGDAEADENSNDELLAASSRTLCETHLDASSTSLPADHVDRASMDVSDKIEQSVVASTTAPQPSLEARQTLEPQIFPASMDTS